MELAAVAESDQPESDLERFFAKPIEATPSLIVPTVSLLEVFKRIAQQRDEDQHVRHGVDLHQVEMSTQVKRAEQHTGQDEERCVFGKSQRDPQTGGVAHRYPDDRQAVAVFAQGLALVAQAQQMYRMAAVEQGTDLTLYAGVPRIVASNHTHPRQGASVDFTSVAQTVP